MEVSGSGNLDAVVNVSVSQALVLRGNGAGTFSGATPTNTLVNAIAGIQVDGLSGAPRGAGLVLTAAVTIDLDGDGNKDVIAAYGQHER